MTTSQQEVNETCGRQLGETRFVCDREAGHTGQHRAYLETVDENVFWSDREERVRAAWNALARAEQEIFGDHLSLATVAPILAELFK